MPEKPENTERTEVPDLETSYLFEVDFEDGTKETIQVPRFSTRMKLRLSQIALQKKGRMSEDDFAVCLVDLLVPGLMDRQGKKAPTMISLNMLISAAIEKDGDSILGEGWRKKIEKMPEKAVSKKRGRPRGKSGSKSTALPA